MKWNWRTSFKKSGLLRQGHVDEHAFALIYRFDEEGTHQQSRFTVTMMARLLRVSRAGYYAWKKRRNQKYPSSTPRGFRDRIAEQIKTIFDA